MIRLDPADGSTCDRGLSVAITHVLTIGITTVLIAGLLLGMGSMLDTQTDRSTEQSLETIGERLAGEIASADRLGSGEGNVTISTDHPRSVAGSTYAVEPHDTCPADAPLVTENTSCLELSAHGDVTVHVPLSVNATLEGDRIQGGSIDVVYEEGEDEIRLERRSR